MKKFSALLVLFIALSSLLSAQPYGNEWISFAGGQTHSSQQYFRIGIWKEGVFRISYNDLQNNGVPVSTWFSPVRYQLFSRGREQFIRVADLNNDNVFGPGDYIEFYGRPNDGEYDRALYDQPNDQANPYYSLYNDTSAYFLTYSPFSTTNRRMEVVTDNNYSAYTPESWTISEELKVYGNTYNIGFRDFNDIADNSFTEGEGFLSSYISKNAPFDINYTIQKFYPPGAMPEMEIQVMGANENLHPYQLKSAGAILLDTVFYAYELVKHKLAITNLPASGSYTFQFAPQNDITFPGNLNYMQVAYAKLRYPRTLDYNGEALPKKIHLNGNAGKVYLQLTNLTATNPRLYVVSGDTVRLVNTTYGGGTLQAIVPVNGQEVYCYILEEGQVNGYAGNASLRTVNTDVDPSRYARFNNFAVQGMGKDFLMISNSKIWSGAQNYANYRQSRGFNVLLTNIDELYDQYAWGIRKHTLSIRQFVDHILDMNTVKPKHLLLLGKSVLNQNARSGAAYELNLVPTYGEPASDQMFSAKLNTPDFVQEIATGRVSAQNENDVTAYLNKLIGFESQQDLPPALWMKNVLHFGGGTDLGEQQLLAGKLNTYKQIIEDTLFGGNVITVLKSSTDPIQINLSQYVQQLIDSGCSMMTFYGHAAGTSFDIATDDPENYNNKDRYPVLLAQSCFVGDIHTTSRLLNERFVLTPDKGSIAFIAVPDKGLIDPLDDYSYRFHEVAFRERYGASVSEVMRKTVTDIISAVPEMKSVCMNMTLHGDPAVRMNTYEKPDFVIENAGVFFEPQAVTTEMQDFNLKFVVTNIGKNTADSVHAQISRKMPDGTKRDTIVQLPYITYRDTFSIKLPVDFQNGAGINTFEITIDNYEEVDELDNVGNNVAVNVLQIGSTDINPVYPGKYAIVPDVRPVLKATTANLFSPPKNYVIEIDTTPFFNSPQKLTHVVNNASGIVSWQVPNNLLADVPYFWRVANDSIQNPDTSIANDFQWKSSSFLYKPGVTGWSQAHYYQFREGTLTNMNWVDNLRQTEFITSNYSLNMSHEGNRPSYEINGVNMDYGGCFGTPQLAIAVLDSIFFEYPWEADSCRRYYGNYNYYSCLNNDGCGFRTRPDKYFLFNMSSPVSVQSMTAMLDTVIPNGNYVLSWPVFPIRIDTMTLVHDAFSAIGAPQLAAVDSGEKFLFFMKKGDPSSVQLVRGPAPDSSIFLSYLLSRDWDKGFQSSTEIGPAQSWSQVHWDYTSLEQGPNADSIFLQIWGIAATGQEVLLYDTIVDTANPIDISSVDASQYPRMKLKTYMEDFQLRTPPQLLKWQVYYQPVPEGALNPVYYSFQSDTVQEGDQISLSMAFENISSTGMDTLLVDYFVFDANNVRRNIASVRLNRDLPSGDTVMCNVRFNTFSMAGNNRLWIEANPNKDQPELYHFNNITSIPFHVTRDVTNPLLDVTFDGIHILNGDIVSARPAIQISLKDENRFILLNDTANFRVSLKTPSGSLKYLHFEPAPGASSNSELLAWIPASLPSNSFRINYSPVLLEDGVYELSVQATDESGNLSGFNDYKIQFEVINKSTVTEVVNYPNPFSTSTRFVFVLTGSEVPTDFRIQIMTVTGKIVKTILRDEIGAIRIGRNITDYAWDGKDDFGDQLANGVYLYRVNMGINGSDIEKRETAADAYFKKGWGKMYLMR